jgi:hypothetical protein
MKSFYLILSNLKKLMKHNIITLGVVLFSFSMIVFGILYYAGYILYSYYSVSGNNIESVNVLFDDSITNEHINNILGVFDMKDNSCQQVIVAEEKDDLSSGQGKLIGVFDKVFEKRLLSGNDFTQETDEPYILLTEYQIPDLIGYNINPIGEKVKINNTELKIDGVITHTNWDCMIVPVKYFINHFHVGYINYIYNRKLNNNEYSKLNESLKNIEGINSYQIVKQKSPLLTLEFWIDFTQIIIIYCLIILNLFTIIRFWVKQSKHSYNIYSVCGGSRLKVTFLIFGQTAIVYMISTLIGLSVFMILQKWLASLELVVSNHKYIFLIIAFIILFLACLFSILTIWKTNKSNEIYYVKE